MTVPHEELSIIEINDRFRVRVEVPTLAVNNTGILSCLVFFWECAYLIPEASCCLTTAVVEDTYWRLMNVFVLVLD